MPLFATVHPNSTGVSMVTTTELGSEIRIALLVVGQLLSAALPVTVTTYPKAVVVGASPVNVAVVAVVDVGAILVTAPSKAVISKVYGPTPLFTAEIVIVPLESPIQVTSVVVIASTMGRISVITSTVKVLGGQLGRLLS